MEDTLRGYSMVVKSKRSWGWRRYHWSLCRVATGETRTGTARTFDGCFDAMRKAVRS